ncbi:MAG: hypothetical protein Q9M40_00785 [Sulfurimonas sp.]|nr:hypothetical protein [Sulfurimonas sp.]
MNKIISTLSIAMLSLGIVSCSNSGSNSTLAGTQTLTGQFIDSPVAGLAFTTNSSSGVTDTDGKLEYNSGETCTFLIGDLELGSMLCAPIMSPYNLGGTTNFIAPTQKTTNIARILQSLNTNADANISIVLNPNVAANFDGTDINISSADLNMTLIADRAFAQASDINYTAKTVSEVDALTTLKTYITQTYPDHIEYSLTVLELKALIVEYSSDLDPILKRN